MAIHIHVAPTPAYLLFVTISYLLTENALSYACIYKHFQNTTTSVYLRVEQKLTKCGELAEIQVTQLLQNDLCTQLHV